MKLTNSSLYVVASILLALICPAVAQQTVPNLADCISAEITWVKNICSKPISVQVMVNNREIRRQLKPGEKANTGDFSMGAACPIGYVSSVPFVAENSGIIGADQYECNRK